jgi:serine protease inhibitor
VSLNRTYETDVGRYYNSSVQEIDFEDQSAKIIINRWVSKRTQGQIPELLETPLPQDTKLLLVNALAFKAFWKSSFDPTRTAANGIFHHDTKTKYTYIS